MKRDAVAIIGSGLMGPGIAAGSALAGNRTKLLGRTVEKAEKGVEKAKQCIKQLLDNQLAEETQAQEAYGLLEAGTDIEKELKDSCWVIESITENLESKQELFEFLDGILPPETVISSNTSGLRITEISFRTKHPGRTLTTHFWFPAHLIPLVEVVMGDRTHEKTAMEIRELLLKWNKAPVIVRKDLPGQLANRILQAIIRESINIVQMGLAAPEDVDTSIKMGMGIRFPAWGPFEHIDAVGLDLALSVQKTVLPGISNDTVPSKCLQKLVDDGKLGYKTGSGFYDWSSKDMKELMKKRDGFIMNALKIIKA